MEPKEYFKRKILGQLVTRKIDRLSLDGVPTEIKDNKVYDVIDIIDQEEDRLFVVNTWHQEENKSVLAIHNNFVMETIPHELRFRK